MTGKTEEQLNGILNKVANSLIVGDGSDWQQSIKYDASLETESHFAIGGIPSNSVLEMNGDSVRFHFRNKKPNWWFRMWYRLLLGWRWFDK